jgi:uncharacterized membrane protein
MANRAVVVILVLLVLALIVLGVNYVLDYLGTDVLLNLYPWGEVSVQRLLRNTVVFALAMVGWLITLVALIMGILEMRSERLW